MRTFSALSLFALVASSALAPAFANPIEGEVEAREWHSNKHHEYQKGSQNGHHQGGSEHGHQQGGQHGHQQGGQHHNGGHQAAPAHKPIKRANVVLRIFDEAEIQGGYSSAVVYFTQEWEHGPVSIKGEIIGLGLEPDTERGWHVHEHGDLAGGCKTAGLHFNPQGQNHGAPWDHERHVGDLGNFEVDENGDAYIDNKVINDRMSLNGPNSIIGRTLVIHLGTDDLGKGGQPDSLTVGASGGRLACGIIGVLPDV